MNNYSFIHKFLHDFVLKNKIINKSLFELEKLIYLRNENGKNETHIFISGLPRSGTTVLLNFIYSSNQFASLTYRDIPFVLSPNFSKNFNKKNINKKERLHADGIYYDINSPEAFDEIFFKNKEEFIKSELVNYIKLILLSKNKFKYLSKNNLNYQRINLISSILPNSIFLIPIRKPLQHSFSLLNQHLHFSKLQNNDNFMRRYMNYLSHNEFGLDHKPWNKPVNFSNLNDINYWLEQWYLFYHKIYRDHHLCKNCFFVIYEKLDDPIYIKKLLNKINLQDENKLNLNYFTNGNKKKVNLNYDKKIYGIAQVVYDNFINKFMEEN